MERRAERWSALKRSPIALEPSSAPRRLRLSPTVSEPKASRLAQVIATGLGAGYVPLAPGTAGTAVAVPLAWALSHLSVLAQLVSIGCLALVAVWAAQRAGRAFGNADDPRIVSDEVAGFMVTVALLPATPGVLFLGFVLFRVLDQLKPWPASYFDRRVKNGWGNVLDDVVAGLYGRACLELVLEVWARGG